MVVLMCLRRLVTISNVVAERLRGFVRPTARHVANRVAASAQHEQRQVVPLHELNALAVTFQGQVEAAETVARERVCAALQHDRARLVHLHHLRHDLDTAIKTNIG